MRLHHLSMTAFGPFAGCAEVDFDELCEAGLFLLTGPTGAGKTTILDAVCFALYGSVPGVRGVKALKSQHAGDDARPEVVLDFSVRDRRFVIRRSPEWSRPKRRGTGDTTENARATLLERTTGEDHLLSSRAQEVGHFVGELVGMQSTQFVQVAMLPQGDFQKFLRASSQDRHDVLQHLFRTDRYARIEDWVHDHSRGLKERSAGLGHQVVRVLDTLADRAAAEVPEHLRGDALQGPEAQESALAWVGALLQSAETAHAAALEQHTAAATAARTARSRHEDAERVTALHERRRLAESVLDQLELEADEARQATGRLEADGRASACLPLLGLLDEAVAHRDHVREAWAAVVDRLSRTDLGDHLFSETLTADALADAEQETRSRIARLEALLPRERELATARRNVEEARLELAGVATRHAAATDRAATLPLACAEAREQAAVVGSAAGRCEALTLELAQARGCLEAAEGAAACAESLPTLRDAERDARDHAADARDRVQDLTARRLAGIAAELAGRLGDGQACQVCGSTDHPRRATSSVAVVTEAEQTAAAAAFDTAAADLSEASGRVQRAEQRLEHLRAAAQDLRPVDASALVDALTADLREAEAARSRLAGLQELVERLTHEQQEMTAQVHDLEVQRATLTRTVESLDDTITTLATELAGEIDLGVPVTDQISRLIALATTFGECRETRCELDAAEGRVAELEQHVRRAVDEHGFDTVAGLRSAALEASERRRLEELLEVRAQRTARAAAVLEDESVRALADEPVPDIESLAAASGTAAEQERSAARSVHQCDEALEALTRHRERLVEALSAWAPVRAEHLRAESMSRLVRGMGTDNQLQMRLSAYVLATRLDQVVAAANERLAHMRDQRYLLQRTGRVARKGAQAGLGLEVVDQWTGDVRDPATLSGGETFVVSLALALGLADVVTQEAGGTEIETLFVDEGFGTLDADTLDDVMDRLDDLRSGGRAVGVVSHVSEMRNRIPTQLHVEKRRNGSVVSVRTAVG